MFPALLKDQMYVMNTLRRQSAEAQADVLAELLEEWQRAAAENLVTLDLPERTQIALKLFSERRAEAEKMLAELRASGDRAAATNFDPLSLTPAPESPH